jgi:nicotinamidase-related amidase
MAELTIDRSSTALVLIDLQRGIATGNLAPNAASDVVARGAELVAAFRKSGTLIVLVHVDPGPNGELFPRPQADTPRPPFNAPPEWSELVPELGRQPSDVVVLKHQPNAFYCTDLEVHLRRRGITTIVLGGIATNLGVESTARAAFERGYEQVFVADAMTARTEVLHTHTVTHILPTMGRVRTTAEVIKAIA